MKSTSPVKVDWCVPVSVIKFAEHGSAGSVQDGRRIQMWGGGGPEWSRALTSL